MIIQNYILNSKNDLSHLVVSNDNDLPIFLLDVYENEEKYEYLNKIFDSRENGFKNHIKLFKINFEKFNLNIKK